MIEHKEDIPVKTLFLIKKKLSFKIPRSQAGGASRVPNYTGGG
jgi:hypothetical protein